MSQIVAFCPSCQKKYKIDTSLLGRVLKCKACETLFEISAPPEPTPPAAAPPQTVPAPVVEPAVDPLAVDPLAIDPLAIDPLAIDPLAIDPLAIDPLAGTTAPSIPNPAVAAASVPATAAAAPSSAGWKQAVAQKQNQKQQPITGNDRALLLLGGFLLIFGLVMNLLPLFGMQVAKFQGTGKTGQVVGLLMGLAGAGLLAGGLGNFRLAAIISGSAGGGFLLLVFLVSLFVGREPDVANTLAAGKEGDLYYYDINNVSSPWDGTYPEWEGFSNQVKPRSAGLQWRRVASGVEGVSASFYGPLEAVRNKLTIDGQEVSTEKIRSRVNQQTFELVTFEYPDSNTGDSEMLDAVEATVRGITRSNPISVETFSAREYSIRGALRGHHGVIVVAGTTIIHARVAGTPSQVPGENSQKFVASLQIDAGVETGSVRSDSGSADALDPFTFENSGGNQASPRLPSGQSNVPGFQLSAAEKKHDSEIQGHNRALQGAMEEHISMRVQISFSTRYLSVSAGEDVGNPRYIAHPGKVPITGVDFVVARSGNSNVFTNITPVYDTAASPSVVQARTGYGLSGLRVNARQHVEGIKFVFSKVTERGFDQSQSYETDWYGTPASGSGQIIDSGGRPVYGLWMCKRIVTTSIGLIREK